MEVMYSNVYLCVTKQINTMTLTTAKRITKATVKSFITRQSKADNLWIMRKSDFSGYTDCVESISNPTFVKTSVNANVEGWIAENTMGVDGAWFVGSSRDYFEPFEDAEFTGIKVYNSCGSFILAAKK